MYTLGYKIHKKLVYFLVWGLKQLFDPNKTLADTLSPEGLRISF